jgi:hypothetical protein
MPYIGNPIYQSAFVTDQFSGNGSTTAFTMSVAPAGVTNVLVAVSGVLQDPSTYGVVGNTITFSAAPPSGTGNISCRYLGVPASGVTTTAYRTVTEFTATASQTTFTPPSYTVGFISVFLNGVLLGSADYTATNGTTVVLATGASAGNLLTVESFLVSSVLNAIPNTAGSVLSSNISSGVTINFADGSASTPSITNDGDTNTGMFFPAADTIAFAEGGTEAMRINSSGGVSVLNCLGVGNATPSTSGAGITFPATQSASSDANTLDDYEEGTWTPNVGGNATYTVQVGRYVKIGSQVTAWGQIIINVLGTGSTEFIFGLPFTSANILDNLNGGAVTFFSGLAINQIAIYLRVEPNASSVRTATMSASASGVTNSPSIFGNSTRMAFVVTYIVA